MDQVLISKLKSAGATCVAGALILNRETVALLRHGQVILTPEGEVAVAKLDGKALIEDAPIKSEVRIEAPAAASITEVVAIPDAKPAAKARVVRGLKPAAPAAEPIAPSSAPPADPVGATDLDTLLSNAGA